MEEQHPIPQQISTYQFRLVGDMTLKQFLQVGGGILISLIIYSTPIIGIIKWPLVIISALGGAALAFLPFQERPLEKWIFAFLRSIYSPTLFYWKRLPEDTLFFQEPTAASVASLTPQVAVIEIPKTIAPPPPPPGYPELAREITPPQVLSSPIPTVVEKKPFEIPTVSPVTIEGVRPEEVVEPGVTIFPNLEEAEKTFLSKITGLFSLAPSLQSEDIFKRIFGGCQTVVEGLGALRNKLSDAHGKGKAIAKPEPRHAELAVNLAGAMATFLVETWEAQKGF